MVYNGRPDPAHGPPVFISACGTRVFNYGPDHCGAVKSRHGNLRRVPTIGSMLPASAPFPEHRGRKPDGALASLQESVRQGVRPSVPASEGPHGLVPSQKNKKRADILLGRCCWLLVCIADALRVLFFAFFLCFTQISQKHVEPL